MFTGRIGSVTRQERKEAIAALEGQKKLLASAAPSDYHREHAQFADMCSRYDAQLGEIQGKIDALEAGLLKEDIVFEYDGPAIIYTQEGGYAAPAMGLDDETGALNLGVGYFEQMARSDDPESTLVGALQSLLNQAGIDAEETIDLERVVIKIEIKKETTP